MRCSISIFEVKMSSKYKDAKSFKLNEALKKTFKKRKTHQIPKKIELPPVEWEERYNKMSQDCGLGIDVHKSFKILDKFWNTFL